MIFTLTQAQIDQIRSNLFPNLDLVDLKTCTLNLSGTDTIFKLNIIIRDPETKTKIFNNKTSQKMMKMIIFDMFDNNIRNQALNCKTSLELQALIRNYGLINYEFSPCFDFDGHKSDIKQHNISDGYLSLSYKKDFILPESTVENFSLGIALYYDFDVYVKEQNIKPEFIEKQILFGGVKVFDLVVNKEPSTIVNDLRLVKSLFKKQESDSQFKYTEDKAATGFSLLETIDNDTRINKNVTKILSEKQKTINNDIYFSNAYYSRNRDGKLSFLFNIDYKNLITNNSSYKQFIINSSLQDEFINNITLSSIKILRRRIVKSTKKDKPKIYNKDDTVTTIINANDNKQNGVVEYLEQNDASIKENSLSLSNQKSSLRSFEITDGEVFGLNSGLYQYGVELSLEDAFFDKILQKIGESRQDIRNLKAYLKETEKTIKTIRSYDQTRMAKPNLDLSSVPVMTSQVGVYDPATNSFTKEFIKNYIKDITIIDEEGKQKTYNFSSLNNDAVSRFITLLELFGIKMPLNNDKTFIANTFLSMLNPETASSETIIMFINTYEKFINKMEKIFSGINKNKKITIQNWFTNDYVNVEQQIGIGYEFIENEDKNGLGTISVKQLSNIIEKEIFKYSKNKDAKSLNITNKYGFISPSAVYTDNRALNFDSVISDPESISQYEFAETEIDIKRLNLLDKSGNNITITNLPNNLPPRQQELNLRMNNIMHDLSISIPNLLLTPVSNKNNLSRANDNRVVYNAKVDPSYLFLSLAKNINISDNKLAEKKIDKPFIKSGKAKKKYGDNYEELVPMQVRYLLDEGAKLLNSEDNYLTSIDLNSIFLFFYNSIHHLEYLNYSIDKAGNHILKDEQWLKLDEKFLNTIEEEDLTVLCRLKNYQDAFIDIKDWEQIKLPIYNQYFLLSGKPTFFSKRNPRPRVFDGFSNTMRSIIDDSTTNRLIRGLAPPPHPPPPVFKAPERLPGNATRLIGSLTPENSILDMTSLRIPKTALSVPPPPVVPANPALQAALKKFESSVPKASLSVRTTDIAAIPAMQTVVGVLNAMQTQTNTAPAPSTPKFSEQKPSQTQTSPPAAKPAASAPNGKPPFVSKIAGKFGK